MIVVFLTEDSYLTGSILPAFPWPTSMESPQAHQKKNTTSPTSGPLHVIVPIGNPTLYLSRCPLSSYFQTTEPVFPSQSRLLQETHPSLIE